MSDFKFNCPQCGQHILCDVSYAGITLACPVCQQSITVPTPAPPGAPSPPAAPVLPQPAEPAAPAPASRRLISGANWVGPATGASAIVIAAAVILFVWQRNRTVNKGTADKLGQATVGDSSASATGPESRQEPRAQSATTSAAFAVPVPSSDSLDTLWQVQFNVRNQPAREVIVALAGEFGVGLDTSSAEEKLANAVTVRDRTGSRAELMEAVCQAAGSHILFGADRLIVKSGSRNLPVAFGGPWVLQVDPAKPGTSSLLIRLYAYSIPPLLAARYSQSKGANLMVTRSVGPDGKDARNRSASFRKERIVAPKGTVALSEEVPLLRGVERVSELAAMATIQWPREIYEGSFPSLKPGEKLRLGPISATLTSVGKGQGVNRIGGVDLGTTAASFHLQGPLEDTGGDPNVVLTLRTAAGDEIEPFSTEASGDDQNYRLTIEGAGRAASIHGLALIDVKERSFEFTLKDVALQKGR